jgi:hypothetical protein
MSTPGKADENLCWLIGLFINILEITQMGDVFILNL